jgi:uncharacterized coiled-coil DUF342 family protein
MERDRLAAEVERLQRLMEAGRATLESHDARAAQFDVDWRDLRAERDRLAARVAELEAQALACASHLRDAIARAERAEQERDAMDAQKHVAVLSYAETLRAFQDLQVEFNTYKEDLQFKLDAARERALEEAAKRFEDQPYTWVGSGRFVASIIRDFKTKGGK